MKPTTRQCIFWTLLSLLLIAGISFGGWKLYRAKFWASSFRKAMIYADKRLRPETPDRRTYKTLSERAEAALALAKRRGLRTDYSLFIDYSVPSGTPRLYVWPFERGKIVDRAYVMHGLGGGSTAAKPVFSNRPSSRCPSLGRFQVTHYSGQKIKRSFRLHGIDFENNTAFARGLMIHSSRHVDRHKHKKHIPLDAVSCQGCVTVSRSAMTDLTQLIRGSSKTMLLWSFAS